MNNLLKDKLAGGRAVLGIWSIINSPAVLEIFGTTGLDFSILDLEHGVFDLVSLEVAVRACEAAGCSPIVRIPGNQPTVIQSCLDIGAHGVMIPQVKDFATAVDAVKATKLPPQGTRGYNPFTRAGGYRGDNPQATKLNNEFGLTSIIIETKGAYDDLDRILGIPELDLLYLGVYDMSFALGCGGNVSDPKIGNFVESAIPRIRAAGKAAGVMAKTAQEIEYFLKLGANFLVYGVDTLLVRNAISDAISTFARAVEHSS